MDRCKSSYLVFVTFINFLLWGGEGASVSQYTCGGQWAVCESCVSPSTVSILEMRLRSRTQMSYNLSHLAKPESSYISKS